MRRIVLRMSCRFLSSAFVKWIQVMDNEVQERALQERRGHIMRRVCASLRFKAVSLSLRAWCHYTRKCQVLRYKSRRIVVRWSNQVLTLAFEYWRDASKEKKRVRDVMGRVVHHLTNRDLVCAFNAWCEFVQEAQEKADLQEIEIAHDQYERTHSRLEEQSRRILMKMLSGHTRIAIDACFYPWQKFTRESKKQMHVIVVSTSRSRRRCLQKAWTAWNVHLQDLYMRRTEVFYAQQYQEIEEEKNVLCKHHLETTMELKKRVHTTMIMYDRDRESLLQEFLELHEGNEAHLRKMREIMLNRILHWQDMDHKWNAFESWLEFVGKGRECRSCLLSQDRCRSISKQLVAILNRLRLQSKEIEQSRAARVFHEWKLLARWQRLESERISMKLQGTTQKALNMWQAIVVSGRRAGSKLSLKFDQRVLQSSFETWHLSAAGQRLAVFTCDNLFNHVCERRKKQWLAAFCAGCREMSHEDEVLTRKAWHVANRVQRQTLEAHMATWKRMTAENIALRGILIQGMMTRLSETWTEWVHAVETKKRVIQDSARHEIAKGEMVMMLQIRVLRSSVDRWRCTVSDKKKIGKRLTCAQVRSMLRLQAKCLDSWKMVCREQTRRQALLKRRRFWLVCRRMAQNLNAWSELTVEAHRSRSICARMVSKRRLRAMQYTLELWAEVIYAESQKLEAMARHALGRVRNRCAHLSFEQWMHRTVHQRMLRRRTAAMMQGRVNVSISDAFKQWRELQVMGAVWKGKALAMNVSFSKPDKQGYGGTEMFLLQLRAEIGAALNVPADRLRGIFLQQEECTATFVALPPNADDIVHELNIRAQFSEPSLCPLPMGVSVLGARCVGPVPVAVAQVYEKSLQNMSADLMLTTELLQEAEVEKENVLSKAESRNAYLQDRALSRTNHIRLAVAFDSFADRVKCRASSGKNMQHEQTQTGSRAGGYVQKTAVAKSINATESISAHLKSGREGTAAALTTADDTDRKHLQPVIEFSMRTTSNHTGMECTNPSVESPTPLNPTALPPDLMMHVHKEQDERASIVRKFIAQSRQPIVPHLAAEAAAPGSGVEEDFVSPAVREFFSFCIDCARWLSFAE